MSFPVSTSLKVTKHGWVEETSPGVPPSSPAFQAIVTNEFTPSVSINNVENVALGSPFIYLIQKVGERYRVAVNFTPHEINMLEYGINTSGTRNRDKSLTFGLAQMLNSGGTLTEQFAFAKGAQCDSMTISGTNEAVTVTSEWVALNYTTWATAHGLAGTPTWEALDSATMIPWTGLTGGIDPIQWNAAAQKVRSYSVTVENAIDEVQFIGDSQLSYAQPTTHRNTVSLDIVYKDDTLMADVKTLTPRTAKIKLATGVYITLTNCVLEAFDETTSADSTEAKTISYTGKAVSAQITTT
jgi:hypothetical protein